MNPLFRRLAVAGVAVLALGACRRPADHMAAAGAERHAGYSIPYNSVGLLDAGLARQVVVEQTGSRRSPTNTLMLWATLRNRTDAKMQLSARTRFFDADKRPLEETSWTMLWVDQRGLATYETSSSRAEAAFYYVEVKAGR